jgi:hypothetical protein
VTGEMQVRQVDVKLAGEHSIATGGSTLRSISSGYVLPYTVSLYAGS